MDLTNIKKQNIDDMEFEKALKILEEVAAYIDKEDNKLENIVESFEIAIKIKNHLQKKIQDAKLKIEKVTNENISEITSSN